MNWVESMKERHSAIEFRVTPDEGTPCRDLTLIGAMQFLRMLNWCGAHYIPGSARIVEVRTFMGQICNE